MIVGSQPRVSISNSTNVALSGSATFTGEWEKAWQYESVIVAVKTDATGTLKIQFSPDGTNIDSSLSYDIASGLNDVHRLTVTRAYCRIVFENGSSDQSYMRLQTIFGQGTSLSAPFSISVQQDSDTIVTRSIMPEIDIANGKWTGYKFEQKFGYNPDVTSGGVPEDLVYSGSVYTGFPVGAPATISETVNVFSSSANDSSAGSGARTIIIYGLDEDGYEQEETLTLNGTTAVTSVNRWYRVNRGIVLTSGSSNQAFNAGNITCRHTTTTANVFFVLPAGNNQTKTCAYTVPLGKNAYLLKQQVYVKRSNTAIIAGSLWVRNYEASPRLILDFSASESQEYTEEPLGGVKLVPLTDFTLRVTETSATCAVYGHMEMILVDI